LLGCFKDALEVRVDLDSGTGDDVIVGGNDVKKSSAGSVIRKLSCNHYNGTEVAWNKSKI
jgi:hypothetical protein